PSMEPGLIMQESALRWMLACLTSNNLRLNALSLKTPFRLVLNMNGSPHGVRNARSMAIHALNRKFQWYNTPSNKTTPFKLTGYEFQRMSTPKSIPFKLPFLSTPSLYPKTLQPPPAILHPP
ncbi:hypothetical protein OIU85_022019, partial [Salix viminalis]